MAQRKNNINDVINDLKKDKQRRRGRPSSNVTKTESDLPKNEEIYSSPLNEAEIIEREYTKPRINESDKNTIYPKEPTFEPPSLFENIEEANTIENDTSENKNEIKNPSLEGSDTKTLKQGATYLAETCINAYVFINDYAKKSCTYNDEKLQKMALQQKLDLAVLELKIPLSEETNDEISIRDFLQNLSKQANELFEVSDEFKDEAKRLLIIIFMKKGWGMTVEQQLLALVVQDIIPKVSGFVMIKKSFKDLIGMASQILIEIRKQGIETTISNKEENVKQTDSSDNDEIPITETEELNEE